jgi:hypothetical protein
MQTFLHSNATPHRLCMLPHTVMRIANALDAQCTPSAPKVEPKKLLHAAVFNALHLASL